MFTGLRKPLVFAGHRDQFKFIEPQLTYGTIAGRFKKGENPFVEKAYQGKNGSWMSVPQFGDWDQKGNMLDYSLDFSKIREMRKHNKRDISRTSIGNDEELIPQRNNNNNINNNNNNDGGGRRKLEEEKLHYKQGFDEETQRRCGGIGC
ncbi:hypothetical protein GIB67_036195 [Kingdonia uniflora]|uniref:RIN4 pathogenic type III effector avirulence factor Avr cleavage site domain-containing protein n=1 Tax=Kingdonia uniflora TaxID=39325 RepID=A0A7J7LH16_9MAGN|nr:hypothetical protein GIB67_036195 [Kingdonia uniflora]